MSIEAGVPVAEESEATLDDWLRGLERDDAAVHDDPDTDQGFFLVPRRADIDDDIIRRPTGRRTD